MERLPAARSRPFRARSRVRYHTCRRPVSSECAHGFARSATNVRVVEPAAKDTALALLGCRRVECRSANLKRAGASRRSLGRSVCEYFDPSVHVFNDGTRCSVMRRSAREHANKASNNRSLCQREAMQTVSSRTRRGNAPLNQRRRTEGLEQTGSSPVGPRSGGDL